MEHSKNDVTAVSKRLRNIVRAMYFVLRKGISKGKLMVDLNTIMKRGKIAGKAMVHSLIFHHHHSSTANRKSHGGDNLSAACSNTPSIPFNVSKRKQQTHHHSHFFACAHAPPTHDDLGSASPELTWYSPVGWNEVASPAVRQVRITDSPFPLTDVDVDEAAEKFIAKFYNALRKQGALASP